MIVERTGLALAAALLACATASAERLPLQVLTASQGLSGNSIHKMVRDSRGFLWFCTSEGLSRFDGYKFTSYGVDQGLPNRVVNDLLEIRSGVYLVATAGGLCQFDPNSAGQNGITGSRTRSFVPLPNDQ